MCYPWHKIVDVSGVELDLYSFTEIVQSFVRAYCLKLHVYKKPRYLRRLRGNQKYKSNQKKPLR